MKTQKFFKQLLITLIAILAISTTAFAAPRLSKTSATIKVGKSVTLKVKGYSKKVTWSSSAKSIATVKKGKVTGKKAGTAEITAKAGKTVLKCKVTVVPVPKSVSLSAKSMTITKGATAKLTASVLPNGVSNKKVKWTSSNKKIATVEQSGNIKAVKKGTVTITAASADNKKVKSNCKVTVVEPKTVRLTLTGASSGAFRQGSTMQMKVTSSPSGVITKYKWTSSNPKVATVDQNGLVKAVADGKTTITVAAADGNKGSVSAEIQVQARSQTQEQRLSVTGIEITSKYKELDRDYKLNASDFTVKAILSDGTYKNVNAALSINASSTTDAKGNGTGRFIVTAKAEGFTKTLEIPMKPFKVPVQTEADKKVTGIEASCKYKELDRNYQLKGTDFTVQAVMSDGSKKNVSASFSITSSTNTDAKGNGTGTFTVTVKAEGFTKTLTIPMKPFTVPVQTEPTKSVSGIRVECDTKEASTITEASEAPLKVYEQYADGTEKETGSYKVELKYDSANKRYVVTVTSLDGKYVSTVYINQKTSTTKTMTSISAECSLREASSIDEITQDTLKVTAAYSDGSKEELKSYKASAKYVSSNNNYAVTITTSDGKLVATVYVKAKEQAQKMITGIDVSCKKSEVSYEEKLSTSDFVVYQLYSDGTKAMAAFTAEIEYEDGYYIATVSAAGYEKIIKIKVTNPPQPETEDPSTQLKSLSLMLYPSYVYVDQELPKGQLKVMAVFGDGSEKEVTDFQTNFVPQSKAGKYTFTVMYMNASKDMTIEVRERTRQLVSVTAISNVTRIYAGDSVTKDMLTVTALYEDGTMENLTNYDISVTPASEHGGKAIVMIRYQGYEMTVEITSYVKTEPESVTFKYSPKKVSVGADLDRSTITVLAKDFTGAEKSVTDFTCDFTPKEQAGKYTFNVSYKGFSESFEAEVE